MAQVRVRKMQEFIKQEVGNMLLRDLKDRGLGFVTVTDVTVTGDLRQATIYVSLFGSPDEKRESLAALHRAKGFIRSQLGKHLTVRYVPEIDFAVDESIEYGSRIDSVLKDLHEKEGKHDGEKA